MRTIPAKVPELGAFRLIFAFEPNVRVPTVPLLAIAVVRIIVTPAPPGVQVGQSSVAPLPFLKVQIAVGYPIGPGGRWTVPPSNDKPPEICVLPERVSPVFIELPATIQLPDQVDVPCIRAGGRGGHAGGEKGMGEVTCVVGMSWGIRSDGWRADLRGRDQNSL